MSQRTDAIEVIIDKLLIELREHADAVQVMVSFEQDEADNKDTCTLFKGAGNFHARVGMAREFLIEDEQRVRNHVDEIDAEEEEE